MLLESHLSLALLDLPQAGGGGGFGGGGGGGLGGGGDGDGVAYLVYLLIRLALVYPAVGVPLLIGVLLIVAYGARQGWFKHQERIIRKRRPARQARISAGEARRLLHRDPAFDERAFLARVRVAFHKAQESWCAQDLEPLRPFVSDGVFERFSLQIEEQREDDWRQGMEGTRLGASRIAHVELGEHFDTLTVAVPFRADIHRVRLSTGERISGSRLPRSSFEEYWSFVRRSGAQTLEGDGLIEGRCPNCGADLAMNASAHCGHCDCLARNGQFDWVLTEITQSSVWRPEVEADVPGLVEYTRRDRGFSVQLLEDHASVAFWRMKAADRRGTVEPLACVATPELCEDYARRLEPREGGSRRYRGDAAVGSVRTLGLVPGDDHDHAVVEVVWDGRQVRVSRDGDRHLDEQRVRRSTLFVFRRRSGETTRLETSFTTAHCQNCGAHDVGGTDPACPWCEAPRRGDGSSWLAHEILRRYAPEARAWLEEIRQIAARRPDESLEPPAAPHAAPPAASRDGLLAWAASLVAADGAVSEREERGLRHLAERAGVPEDRVRELLSTPPDDDQELQPDDPRQAEEWLGALCGLALADGRVSREERRLLGHAARTLGLSRRDFGAVWRRTRGELYRASR